VSEWIEPLPLSAELLDLIFIALPNMTKMLLNNVLNKSKGVKNLKISQCVDRC
jgi:hypothetical protein